LIYPLALKIMTNTTAKTKTIKKTIKVLLVFIPACIFIPKILTAYLILGSIDVCRNKPTNLDTVKRYFLGNGVITWLLSPINLLLDLFSYRNKGIYQLADLPQAYQNEISSLLSEVDQNSEFIKKEIFAKLSEVERGMLFFKWYGDNLNTSFTLPCFQKKYKYIKTIGVSVFNKQKATSVHFGPLRLTFRVLYNFSPATDGEVYIQVGGHKHYWKDNPLFIFDDTLQHQSVNYSDQVRYCMFIDIIRPTKLTNLFSMFLKCLKIVTAKINGIFYKKWVFLR
jgi:aspartyl/asparaginyl beta-hydroxylase (cupin superfamily)